ncbi:uncharacterized protein LOC136079330 [Hydra vulgaris]|uniref:Uncharacterized protein LOC136079330 n=1 Tax=Hydra vulgaris TaxID=6087 RepID=A0ABM4BPS2_HYDVU
MVKNELLVLPYAKQLLIWFVREVQILYGEIFVTYNVHSMIHLADDCVNFGESLDHLSAFPFENFLGQIKKMVQKSHQTVAQIVNQLNERKKLDIFLRERNELNCTRILKCQFLNRKIKEVEVIAKSWMKNGRKCFWPPFKNPLHFVKLSQLCRHWKIYPARILYTTDFYEEAQSRLEKAADASNIENDTAEKKGTKRKRKTAMTFCESDEDIVVGDEGLY